MKKYIEPKISLLVYVEEDILTESVIEAKQVKSEEANADTSVSLKMSDIINLN